MAIFKALSKKEENSANEQIFLMYYFINELGIHQCKLLDGTNSVLFENTNSDEAFFLNQLNEFLTNNFAQINWIGEAKFDEQTENLLNRLTKR